MRIPASLLVGASLSLMSTSSFADCRTDRKTFSVAENQTITYEAVSSGVCSHEFRASARKGTMFKTLDILAQPHHGSLTKISALHALYRAKAGFKGKDSYTLKVCGQQNEGSGCATINYDMTVE